MRSFLMVAIVVLMGMAMAPRADALKLSVVNRYDTQAEVTVLRNSELKIDRWADILYKNIVLKIPLVGGMLGSDVWWSETIASKSNASHDDVGGTHRTIQGINLSVKEKGRAYRYMRYFLPPVPCAFSGKEDIQRIEIVIEQDGKVNVAYDANINYVVEFFGNPSGNRQVVAYNPDEPDYVPPTNVRLMTHTNINNKQQHDDNIIRYKTWGGAPWTAMVKGDGEFIHTSASCPTRVHKSSRIDYMTPNGEEWAAMLNEKTFVHAPKGDFSRSHMDSLMNYQTWDGSGWSMQMKK